ncbi:unnamed protein product [Sphagnum balticum]
MYEIVHWKTPAYKAIADESFRDVLEKGNTLHRTYGSDFVVENMGGDGGYNNQAWTDTDETIVINYVKDNAFYVKKLDKLQYDKNEQAHYARQAMNSLFLQMDADVLSAAFLGAGSVVDDGTLGGTPGNGITLSIGNVQAVCSGAEQALRLANVIYDPSAQFSGDFKLDRTKNMPVAIISAQFYSILLQYLGGKTTELGDNVSISGYVGKFFGFNLYCSNNLSWTGQLSLSTNPTSGDTFTFLNGITNIIGGSPVSQAITFRLESAPSLPGDIAIGVSASATVANIVAALSAPYTASATYVPLVYGNLTTTQQKFFGNTGNGGPGNFYATVNSLTNTIVNVQSNGSGNVPVAQSMTAVGNVWTTSQQKQHCIFGVTKSIAVVLQYGPYLEIVQSNPAPGSNNSGRIGWDFVTWFTYGIKVFNDQSPMLVDVQIDSTNFFSNPVNTFS